LSNNVYSETVRVEYDLNLLKEIVDGAVDVVGDITDDVLLLF